MDRSALHPPLSVIVHILLIIIQVIVLLERFQTRDLVVLSCVLSVRVKAIVIVQLLDA